MARGLCRIAPALNYGTFSRDGVAEALFSFSNGTKVTWSAGTKEPLWGFPLAPTIYLSLSLSWLVEGENADPEGFWQPG